MIAQDRPDYVRPEVTAVKPDLDLMHDLLAGTTKMHEKAATYIRKWKDEAPDVFRIRSKCSEVFDGIGRTLSAAVGMLSAKPPIITWNGGGVELETLWENIDNAGTGGTVFVKRFSDTALTDGVSLILVDHTPAPIDPTTEEPVVVTAANEQALGLRVTWAAYARLAIVSWIEGRVNNRTVAQQVVLYEPTKLRDGRFGIIGADRYRILWLENGVAMWELVELTNDGNKPFKTVGGPAPFKSRSGKTYDQLPIAVAYTGRTEAMFVASVPLLPVGYANLSHWRASTNLAFYAELCAFPQPVLKGQLAPVQAANNTTVPGKLRVGPMVSIQLHGPDADFKWAELSGTSLNQLKTLIDEKMLYMSKLGVSFLATDTRAAETAEAKRLDATAENSTLATSAQGIDDCVNQAFVHTAWYYDIAEPPTFELSRDFESTMMDPQTMAAYINAVANAGLPIRILLEAWQSGGRIPIDVDLDELENEMAAQKLADEEAAREQMMLKAGQQQQQDADFDIVE